MTGENLRKILKGSGYAMGDIADALKMTRQNLNHHLRKEEVDEALVLLIKEKLKIGFPVSGYVSEPEVAYQRSRQPNARVMQDGDIFIMRVPLVNQYAYAGYLRGYGDEEYLENLPKIPWQVEKEYKGNYCSFEVRGDSMRDGSEDGYREGDKVLCREIAHDHWRDKLHIRKWDFIIVHKTEGILLKKIVEHDTAKGILKLHSLNDQYEDFEINLKDVAQIFNVVQVARKK